MSRRHLPLVVVALASLALSACSASPTAPASSVATPSSRNADVVTPPPTDTTSRSGWSGSNG